MNTDVLGNTTEDWFKNLRTGEVKEDKAVSGKKGDEVALYGSADTWQNLGKTKDEPEVGRAQLDYYSTHHTNTHLWVSGKLDQDYTFDGGAVAGIVVGNVLKPAFKYVGSKFFTKAVTEEVNYLKLLKSIDEFDPVKTLYRGTTGSEANSALLFLTDDAAVAATYVKNGGKVVSYDLSQSSLFMLEQAGKLNKLSGKHLIGGATSTEYKFVGKEIVNALNSIGK